MLPFLGPVLGRGKVGNFLIRNKWRSYDAIRKLQHIPMLMLSAGQVHILQARSCSHAAPVSQVDYSLCHLFYRRQQLCMTGQVSCCGTDESYLCCLHSCSVQCSGLACLVLILTERHMCRMTSRRLQI